MIDDVPHFHFRDGARDGDIPVARDRLVDDDRPGLGDDFRDVFNRAVIGVGVVVGARTPITAGATDGTAVVVASGVPMGTVVVETGGGLDPTAGNGRQPLKGGWFNWPQFSWPELDCLNPLNEPAISVPSSAALVKSTAARGARTLAAT